MMLPVQSQSLARSENATPTRDITQILQPNVEQSARVVNVRQDPVSPTLFRISLEIGNHRLDVMTNRPLAEGLTVLLSRDSRGEVSLRLPLPSAPTTTQTNQAQALNQLSTQANQFVAMIAPESRAQAQQMLAQTQMTALVQPQLTTSTAAAVTAAVANQVALNSNQGSSTATSPSTNAGSVTNSSVATTSTASTASLGAQLNSGTSAAQSAVANQPAIEALTQIRGQTGQGASQQQALTSSTVSAVAPSGTTETPAAQRSAPTPPQTAQSGVTQTTSTNQTSAAATAANISGAAQATPPGSTQTALVLAKVVQSIEPSASQPNVARATINVGGEAINIISPRPLLAGQQIQVTRLSEQAVQIRLLPPQPVKTLPAEVVEEMQALLRQATPLQAPLADSLNQMRALSSGQSQDAVGKIVRSLMSLFSLTPQTKPEASAKQVEQMMQQSGMFTENRLASQARGLPLSVEDLRTRLGQLRRASQELPTQVREQMNALIDRAEARTTHQQINSARQWRDYPDGSAERYFRMDLPLQTPEGFKQVELELREQRRPISPTELQTNWTLNLHFDLNPIGAVDARVHLEDEWVMSVAFWAQSRQTTEMIRDRLESFSAHLEKQGFQIDTINVRKGKAPNDLAPAISKHLVDVHT
ncbi:MAG: flagellar hook-length control protein FliK [Oceanospirillaceae bacterium]|nr:flagellar hook-length control protein FliK [Oceanospirillaceae bacterium]